MLWRWLSPPRFAVSRTPLGELAYEIPVSPHVVDNTGDNEVAACSGGRDSLLGYDDVPNHVKAGHEGRPDEGVGKLG